MSVSQWVCHTKRVERSTDRNLPPIFTKLATKVESQEMWLPIVLVGIRNISIRQTGSGINPHHCSYGKYIFNVKYLENGKRCDVGLKGGQIGNRPWALDWHHDLWPWITLNCLSSRSLQLQSNISITTYGMQQHSADTRSVERISCSWINLNEWMNGLDWQIYCQ